MMLTWEQIFSGGGEESRNVESPLKTLGFFFKPSSPASVKHVQTRTRMLRMKPGLRTGVSCPPVFLHLKGIVLSAFILIFLHLGPGGELLVFLDAAFA